MGILRGFHACHIGTLDFALCRDGFSGWIFRRGVSRWHLLFLLQEKHTPRKFGEKFSGKIRWNFRRVFRCVFRYVIRCIFRWTTSCLEIGKIRAESVLQERPRLRYSNYFQKTATVTQTFVLPRKNHHRVSCNDCPKQCPKQNKVGYRI